MDRKNWFRLLPVCLAGFLLCAVSAVQAYAPGKEKKHEGWVVLFNGNSLEGWISPGKDTPPSLGWEIRDGILSVAKTVQGIARGGDIITQKQYSDFELQFEFRLSPGANSGVKYFFANYEKGGWIGFEYQVLDDEVHPDGKLGMNGNRKTASLYDVLPSSKNKTLNPPGQWNKGRIISRGNHVEHWLNGKKVLQFKKGDDVFMKAYRTSKFKDSSPVLGMIPRGHILIQDHGDEVSYRNIRIREFSGKN